MDKRIRGASGDRGAVHQPKKVAFFRIFVYAISCPLTDVNRHV